MTTKISFSGKSKHAQDLLKFNYPRMPGSEKNFIEG